MGITAIKRIINRFPSKVEVTNLENPDKPNNSGVVARSRELEVDMWIPWATKAADVDKHSIHVSLSRGRAVTIYQGELADGDFVRVMTRGDRFPGSHIGGHAEVNGDRHMKISRSGAISLIEI